MHDGEPYGYLSVEGKPLTVPQIVTLVGVTSSIWRKLSSELLAAGVPSVREDGCWFSRRMVRDEEIRVARARGGDLGGNPALNNSQKDNLSQPSKDNLPAAVEVGAISRARPLPLPVGEVVVAVQEGIPKGNQLPPEVEQALAPYLRTARYPDAVESTVRMLLDPRANPHYTAEEIVTALRQMKGANRDFKESTLRSWCATNRVEPAASAPLPGVDPYEAAERRLTAEEAQRAL